MRIVTGRSVAEWSVAEFAAVRRRFERASVDVGTGDGRFVLKQAEGDAVCLAIGIDAVKEAMADSARRSRRRRIENALFVWAGIERPPTELVGVADAITVNYPWGSLLQAMVEPRSEVLRTIAALGRPGADLTILLNGSVFDDPAYAARIGLPVEPIEAIAAALVEKYREVGIEVVSHRALDRPPPHRTRWGQRLGQGARRRSYLIAAKVDGTPPPRAQ
jgi:16S rRNA (adenine(1408)-N(1))-methyltransferase